MKREPAPALERLIAQLRESGADEVAGWYEALLADTPDARKVRDWFKKHGRPNPTALRFMSGAQDWECEIWSLVSVPFAMTPPVSARERAGNKARKGKAAAAVKEALALVAALEDDAGPPVPSVLALFHPERAVDILRAVPPARYLLRLTGYSAEPHDGYQRTENPVFFEDGTRSAWQDPAAKLARHFGGAWGSAEAAQLFPDLLRRLADYIAENAERELAMAQRLPRPNTPNGDAIAFAHAIHRHFLSRHDQTPWGVIAALVRIRHPEVDPPPGEDAVKDWVDHKPDQ